MKLTFVAVTTLLATVGSALAQSPYGMAEFRWRERGLAAVTNTASVPPGAVGFTGVNLDAVTNPTLTTDARFALILEMRVTRAAGNTDLKGLFGLNFNMVSTDSRTQGQFAASSVNASADKRNVASASATVATTPLPGGPGVVLPAGATLLPGTDGQGDRGSFGPFRRVADLGGKNQPAVGVQNFSTTGPRASLATLENITLAASVDPLTYVDPDTGSNGPYFGRTDFYGLNTWVPVYAFVYNVADVTTARTIRLQPVIPGVTPADPGLRGFRGINNPTGSDSWIIDGTIPEFQITVPGPQNCPQFTTNPADASACPSAGATFVSLATDVNPITYRWQIQVPPSTGPWIDLTVDTINLSSGVNLAFTGRTSASLGATISSAPSGATGAVAAFRSVATSTCGSNNSNPATLSISASPTITGSLANVNVCPSGIAAVSIAATGTGNLSTQWQIQNAAGAWVTLSNTVSAVTCAGGSTAYAFTVSQSALTASIGVHGCPRASFSMRALVSDQGSCQPVPSNTATLRVCPADVDCNGASNLDDIFQFINIWFSGC